MSHNRSCFGIHDWIRWWSTVYLTEKICFSFINGSTKTCRLCSSRSNVIELFTTDTLVRKFTHEPPRKFLCSKQPAREYSPWIWKWFHACATRLSLSLSRRGKNYKNDLVPEKYFIRAPIRGFRRYWSVYTERIRFNIVDDIRFMAAKTTGARYRNVHSPFHSVCEPSFFFSFRRGKIV